MKMEDIDGGLHPAVDRQSLDEDEDEERILTQEWYQDVKFERFNTTSNFILINWKIC